jgi:transposase
MATRFVNIDRDSPMLLPVDLREWLRGDHIVHFILDAVAGIDLRAFRVNSRGCGSAQYPPAMMLSLLIYCYATGRFSSRVIEAATYCDVAVRYICGGDHHPDHDTICAFRRENGPLFQECFVKVLAYAGQSGVLKKVGGVSVDGTKVEANASKHAAVSYKRAGEMLEQLELEVLQLTAKAEQADSTPLDDGMSIPAEIERREDRKAVLAEARRVIEERFAERRAVQQKEHEAKLQERAARQAAGERLRGEGPPPPTDSPADSDQMNFTDPDSRIMKAGNGSHFVQAYNAQLAVDTEGSLLIMGQRVTEHANDKQELVPTVQAVDPELREITQVLADSGFFSKEAVAAVEADGGPTVYAAVEKTGHHRTVADLEKKTDPPPPPPEASATVVMRHRLRTAAGRETYKLRKQTVEPVIGIIKQAMGFRRFSLRGKPKVSTEWTLVTLAYNVRRLFRLIADPTRPQVGQIQACSV